MIETEVFFEDHKRIIEKEMNKAKSSVHVAVAWINFKTYYSIFEALTNKKVELNIICSDNHPNRSHLKEIQQLEAMGAKIRLLKMPRLRNHMHHKFAIIDDNVIINGSFNWSPNAEKSFENLMVIRNAYEEVKKFKEEFRRLSTIESDTIKSLQKKIKCPIKGCNGNIYNILVFSERSTKYFETYGDIISICNECYEYTKPNECISNTQLEVLLSELGGASDDYEFEYLDKLISELLEAYQNDDNRIHAVGRVKTTLDGRDEEWLSTNILWKNKFVGDKIPDEFENENFEVVYDN